MQFLLYAALRREQAAAVATSTARAAPEGRRILAFARSAFRELEVLLAGRPADIADRARDGEWSLRDLLRHAIAVELRYREQVRYAAERRDDEPLAIPRTRLPCDRLAPPEPAFAASRTGDVTRMVELLGQARDATDERLDALSGDVLARPALWGTVTLDVRDRMHQIAVHLVEVVLQAEKMLGETTAPEAARIVRRVRAIRGLHERSSGVSASADLDAQLAALARTISSAPVG